ncbi:hypothetical protein NDU88_001360 [Pleurodeles waltl]|uniref:Uncharacterized protein n=1 Tax=Pleurodeles waltl TaxID=8319 RepID=A0AAV7THJ9_PLEWA|nr:hypothetical protein NDU88_001360 [Pleurodeles waltl]
MKERTDNPGSRRSVHEKLKTKTCRRRRRPPPRHKTRGNQDVSRRQPQAGPSREQAAKERAQMVAEMELQAGSLPPPVKRGEQPDADVPDLDDEQMHAILGGGPLVTPQTAEDVLYNTLLLWE